MVYSAMSYKDTLETVNWDIRTHEQTRKEEKENK